MLYKFLKIIFLSSLTLIWGCSNDSSSNSKEPIACELDHMWSPDDPSCTNPYSCTDIYYCNDKIVCYTQYEENKVTLDCRDENGNKTIYNEDEFKSKYYVDGERIH